MNDDQSNHPRNILYIFTDDQSFRSVSCYPEAHSWISTPNIDRLAQLRQGTIDELRRTDAGMVDNLPPVKVMTREQLLGGFE